MKLLARFRILLNVYIFRKFVEVMYPRQPNVVSIPLPSFFSDEFLNLLCILTVLIHRHRLYLGGNWTGTMPGNADNTEHVGCAIPIATELSNLVCKFDDGTGERMWPVDQPSSRSRSLIGDDLVGNRSDGTEEISQTDKRSTVLEYIYNLNFPSRSCIQFP